MVVLRTVSMLAGSVVLAGCFTPAPQLELGSDTSSGAASETEASSMTSPTSMGSTSSVSDGSTTATADATTVGPGSTTNPDDSTGPEPEACGNGTVEGDEQCDDGNGRPGDGCSAACLDETLACAPGLLGALAIPGQELRRIAFNDGYVYGLRTGVPSQLTTIDVTDPTGPTLVGNTTIDEDNYPFWNPGELLASQTHLWTSGVGPDLLSIDVSSPEAPVFDFFNSPNEADGHMSIVGNLLFQARSVSEQIRVWDISDPSGPAGLPSIGNPSRVFTDVAAAGESAVILAGSHIEVWNMSTPAVPSFEGELDGAPWTTSTRSVANADTVAVATNGQGIGLIDYSIPTAPSIAGTIDGEASPRDVAIRGDYVYVPVTNGLRVYDVSTPSDPTLAGSYAEVKAYGIAVTMSEEHLYLETEGGLRVIEDLPGFCDAVCGNNTVEYPESCDDGNLADGDGCSAACENE